MIRIYITFPLNIRTIEGLNLREGKVVEYDKLSILYEPQIGQKQSWRKKNTTLEVMRNGIQSFVPDVVVIGNNKIPEDVFDDWMHALSTQTRPLSPMIIRRGIEMGGVPVEKAKDNGVVLKNIPSINSPYVARHMLRHLELFKAQPGQTIAVLGAGDIGLPIIKAAARNNLKINVISDSLLHKGPHERMDKITEVKNFLHSNQLESHDIFFPKTIAGAIKDSDYLAISVPWWLPRLKRHNIDMISVEALSQLSNQATIVSASNPRIFSQEALYWMDQQLLGGRLSKVRIDTGHSYAAEVYERYQCHELDVQAGQAFYYEDCLIRLDRFLFKAIFDHADMDNNNLLFLLPRPADCMDIDSYVVNRHVFYEEASSFITPSLNQEFPSKLASMP